MSWIITWNTATCPREPPDFAPVSVWLNSDAHRVLNRTVAQTAAAAASYCHSGPGGVGALAPLSRLLGNCFSAPGLFMFCDWIIRPRAREAPFVARLGCFSALPLSWLFQRGSAPAGQSRRYWHILYSVYPAVTKTGRFLLKVISHQRHLSPVYLFLPMKPIKCFFSDPFAFLKTQLSPVCLF